MTTKTKLNIHQRILAIMEEVDHIAKEDKLVNKQYSYVSHDAVTKVLHPQFVKHGVTVLPNVIDKKHDGNRCELTVEFIFVNADDPTDRTTATTVGYGIDSQDKGPGKALSYAMKTALLKVFVLEAGEPDNERDITTEHKASKNGKQTPAPAGLPTNPIAKSNIDMLVRVAKRAGVTAGELDSYLYDNFKIDKAEDVTVDKFSEILADLKCLQTVEE